MKQQPVCLTLRKFFKGTKPKGYLAPLTGQDAAALDTFIHALQLYSYSDYSGQVSALLCMHHAVMAMQEKCRAIAREALPHIWDWGHRETFWPHVLNPEPKIAELRGMELRFQQRWAERKSKAMVALADDHDGEQEPPDANRIDAGGGLGPVKCSQSVKDGAA